MNYYQEIERKANEELDALLERPPIREDNMHSDGECFDPWELFPCVYGSYSSEFDALAIDVLEDMQNETHNRIDLASEIFREMLCTKGLCDYGTSPRVCFPSGKFRETLPRLIERWAEYAEIKWKR